MKEDAQNVSRRNFLTKSAGAAAAVTASILVIESPVAANTGSLKDQVGSNLLACPTHTTLTNTVIPSVDNILGTDHVNVKEFDFCGTDITDALNAAIDSLKNGGAAPDVPRGGQILIPRGEWTTRGGHNFYPSISIEGVGTQMNPIFYGVPWGTLLTLVPDEKDDYSEYMFKIDSDQHNCTLKNMSIDLGTSNAIGLLMTNDTARTTHIKMTTVENITIKHGSYGIKVDSKDISQNVNPQFECILNHFSRICFLGSETSFYCNTVNSGFLFDSCHFLVPENGTAIHLYVVGNISVEHCLFVPYGETAPNSTILKTIGLYNSISFYDCQDEGIVYAFQNDIYDYDYISVVYRNCLIQSLFKFNSNGSVLLDSCRAYSVDTYTTGAFPVFVGGSFIDSSTATAKVYLKGQYNFFRWAPTIIYNNAPIATFHNAQSKLIFESSEIGEPEIIAKSASGAATYTINKSLGLINIQGGDNYVTVNNNLVTEDSVIFTQLHTADSGGIRISHVHCENGYFYIVLTGAATNKLRVAFKVEV